MSAQTLREAAYRRSMAREFAIGQIGGDGYHTHDIEGIVTDLVIWENTQDWDFTGTEWAKFIAPHEYDENGLTDAALAKALKNSQTGWVAMIRRPGEDVQTMNLKKGVEGTTPETIEATLREFVSFPEGTVISIFPLVG